MRLAGWGRLGAHPATALEQGSNRLVHWARQRIANKLFSSSSSPPGFPKSRAGTKYISWAYLGWLTKAKTWISWGRWLLSWFVKTGGGAAA